MIKEFAFSVSNRHHFQDANKAGDWQGLNSDTFTSLYDYDEHIIDYYSKNKSLSGFDGLIYIPDEFILDIDCNNAINARDKTIGLIILLEDLIVPHKLYFSGTGFHVGIPGSAFRWKPDKNLHLKVKDVLTSHGIFEYADPSVTDKCRLIRLVNTKNTKSGYWKIEINDDILYMNDEDFASNLKKLASRTQKVTNKTRKELHKVHWKGYYFSNEIISRILNYYPEDFDLLGYRPIAVALQQRIKVRKDFLDAKQNNS